METEATATTMCDIVDKAKDFLERRCNFEVGSANLKGGTGEAIRAGSDRFSKFRSISALTFDRTLKCRTAEMSVCLLSRAKRVRRVFQLRLALQFALQFMSEKPFKYSMAKQRGLQGWLQAPSPAPSESSNTTKATKRKRGLA